MLSQEEKERLLKEYINPFHEIPFCETRETYKLAGCSDTLQLEIRHSSEGKISLYFSGEGCQLCLSSASLMCRLSEGLTLEEVRELLEESQKALMKGEKTKKFEELKFLEAFYKKPNRKHCVGLAWNTLEKELRKFKP